MNLFIDDWRTCTHTPHKPHTSPFHTITVTITISTATYTSTGSISGTILLAPLSTLSPEDVISSSFAVGCHQTTRSHPSHPSSSLSSSSSTPSQPANVVSISVLVPDSSSMPTFGVRYYPENIEAAVAATIQAASGIEKDVSLCSQNVRELAAGLTRIPLAVITHVIVNRVAGLKGDKAFYETTLELLQHVSIAMAKPVSYHEMFVGDCHSCVLYCEKCQCRFGRLVISTKLWQRQPTPYCITMDWKCSVNFIKKIVVFVRAFSSKDIIT